ncbi:MAG: hypothetical protein WC757_00755 [Candidatus Paceibacterota bacterium]|jgi:predicted membrane protein
MSKRKRQQQAVTISPVTKELQGKIVENLSTHSNLSERVVYLYESKIRICLMKSLNKLEDRRAWQVPFGIFLTICVIFPTTEFKDALFSKFVWQAVFLITAVISFVWLICSLYKRPRNITVDNIINELIPSGAEIKIDHKTTKK